MFRMVFTFLLAGAIGSKGAVHDLQKHLRAHTFLASDLRPDLVARTLVDVVDEWKAQASVFADCNASDSTRNCDNVPKAFQKSCGTVTMSIVSGSSGDRDVVKEYMADVCDQKVLTGWHRDRCLELKSDVEKAMVDNSYENREKFDTQRLCVGFWSKFEEGERKRAEKEAAERAEAEKKAAEERAAAEKEAEEEAKRKAEQEAKEAKERAEKEAEEAKEKAKEKAEKEAKEAAAKTAELAKKQVAEAAARLAAKKAEAEEVARAAKQKLEEAEKAEQEHHELLARVNSTFPVSSSQNTDVKSNDTQTSNNSTPTSVALAAVPANSSVKTVTETQESLQKQTK